MKQWFLHHSTQTVCTVISSIQCIDKVDCLGSHPLGRSLWQYSENSMPSLESSWSGEFFDLRIVPKHATTSYVFISSWNNANDFLQVILTYNWNNRLRDWKCLTIHFYSTPSFVYRIFRQNPNGTLLYLVLFGKMRLCLTTKREEVHKPLQRSLRLLIITRKKDEKIFSYTAGHKTFFLCQYLRGGNICIQKTRL